MTALLLLALVSAPQEPSGVADLHQDRQGRLWAAGLHGYSILADGSWTPYRTIGPISPRVVFGIHEEPGTGAIWLAASGGAGRMETGAGEWEVVLPSAGLPHAVVHAVRVDRAGTLWLATRGGLARATAQGLETLYPGTNFRSIPEAPDGTLWFGTSDGALEWRAAGPVRHLAGRTVLPHLVGPDGTLWATAPDGLVRYQGGAWSRVPLPAALTGAEIHDMAVGRDGTLWLATSRGAARHRPGP